MVLLPQFKPLYERMRYLYECENLSGSDIEKAQQELAKKQVKKALPAALKRQNKNGSWGKKETETETFLVLDTIKNTGAP
jgi:hypothetical protein